MSQKIPTYKNTSYRKKGFMNLRATFIANPPSTELMQPRQSSLNNPAINTQATTVFCSTFSQNWLYTELTQGAAVWLRIITTIALNTVRSFARSAPLACDWWDRIHQRHKLGDIMAICTGKFYHKRDSICVGDNMVFRAQFPSIRGIRARFRPPKTARTDAESATALEKSIWSFWRRLFKSMRCILSQTPAFCQSLKRRQQVIPEPQPISLGRYSQGMPVLNTNKIPVNAWRSLTGGLPPFGRGGRFGITGSISFHNLSSSNGLAMALSSTISCRFVWFPISSYRTNHRSKIRFC